MSDEQITPKAKAGAKALVLHRMMQGKSEHWDQLSEGERLNAVAEAVVVLEAADKTDE